MHRLASLCLAATLLTGTAHADGHDKPDDGAGADARIEIMDTKGETMGSGFIRRTPSGSVLVTVSATGLTPGWHAVHLHETGTCDPADGFKSAGGHVAEGRSHGVLSDDGPHPGDLNNQMVYSEGRMVAEMIAPPSLTMEMLSDADGAALIIHATRDDLKSDPSGEAGGRIACGVVTPAG